MSEGNEGEADYYRSMYRPHWFLRNARKYRDRDEALVRLVRPRGGLRLLEMGAARGDTSLFLASLVGDGSVIGIDSAPCAVALATRLAGERKAGNVRFLQADARNLSLFSDASFDTVVLADFVEHVGDDALREALAEAGRVLVSSGALAIYTPNRDHWAERLKASVPSLQQRDHVAVRSAARVVELVARAGFVLDELFFSPSAYPLFGAFDRRFSGARSCRFRTCLRALKR